MKQKDIKLPEGVKLKKVTDYTGFKVIVGIFSAALIAFIAVIIALIANNIIINNVEEQKANSMMTDLLLKAMPESIESTDGNYKFYVEKNEDFDVKTDDPADVVNFYYLDDDNKKVVLEDGLFTDDTGEPMLVTVGFFAKAMENLVNIKHKISSVAIVVAIIFVIMAVWVSYYPWVVKQENKEILESLNKPMVNKKK